MVQAKLKNLRTGSSFDHRFRAADTIEKASMETILALLDEMRSHLPPEFFEEEDPSAFLYDPETGLPA